MSWLEKIHVEDRAKIDTVQDYLIKLGLKEKCTLFDNQVGHQTKYSSMGNKHFSTK